MHPFLSKQQNIFVQQLHYVISNIYEYLYNIYLEFYRRIRTPFVGGVEVEVAAPPAEPGTGSSARVLAVPTQTSLNQQASKATTLFH